MGEVPLHACPFRSGPYILHLIRGWRAGALEMCARADPHVVPRAPTLHLASHHPPKNHPAVWGLEGGVSTLSLSLSLSLSQTHTHAVTHSTPPPLLLRILLRLSGFNFSIGVK